MKIILDLKVVMDTNMFVSGVFFRGPPYRILEAWQSGSFELAARTKFLMSTAGLEEFWRKNGLELI